MTATEASLDELPRLVDDTLEQGSILHHIQIPAKVLAANSADSGMVLVLESCWKLECCGSFAKVCRDLVRQGDRIVVRGVKVFRNLYSQNVFPLKLDDSCLVGNEEELVVMKIITAGDYFLQKESIQLSVLDFKTELAGRLNQVAKELDIKRKIWGDSQKYCYTLLEEIQATNELYNMYGYVVKFDPPKPTKGTDYQVTIRITDHSLLKRISSARSSGDDSNKWPSITLNVFSPSDSLPVQVGDFDIIRCHRVKISLHNGKLQGVITSRSRSSFILYQSTGSSEIPYFSNYPGVTIEPSDTFILKCMREKRDEIKRLHELLDSGKSIQITELPLNVSSSIVSHSESSTGKRKRNKSEIFLYADIIL